MNGERAENLQWIVAVGGHEMDGVEMGINTETGESAWGSWAAAVLLVAGFQSWATAAGTIADR